MYLDIYYIILVVPAIIFSLIASASVNSTFRKYERQFSHRGMTGREAAVRVLASQGVHDVQITRTSGKLTDHYDPRSKVIALSDAVYDSTSCAAIGVAAHEAGHAIQHAKHYAPLKLRNMIIPVTNIGSKLSIPLILIGLIFCSTSYVFIYVAYLGVAFFGLSLIFQLLTLPTEFNASRRALAAIEGCGILDDEEIKGSRKVLKAAAMTYVAALAVTAMQFLRLLLMVAANSRRN